PFFGGPGGGGISSTGLEQYEKILGLTAAQKESAAALHEAYQQDRAAANRDMQDQMKSAREGIQDGDFSVMRDQITAIMRKYGEKTSALEKQFIDDFKSLLTPAQADRWPQVERLRRREQWLRGGGMVSGSGVDLTTLVDSLGLSDADRAKLATSLDEY